MHPDCLRFMFIITPVSLYLRIPGARASFRIITSYYFPSARHINTFLLLFSHSKFNIIAHALQAGGGQGYSFVQKSANNSAWSSTFVIETLYSPVFGSSGGYLYFLNILLIITLNLA